jgi:membrane dipeptidase
MKKSLFLLPFLFPVIVNASGEEDEFLVRAKEIHRNIVTLDSHTDTPLLFGSNEYDAGKHNSPLKGGSKIDFPRMKEGGLDAAFFAVFLSQGESSPEAYKTVQGRTLNIFVQVHTTLEKNKDVARLALNPEDALTFKKEGKRAIFIGLENAYPIGEDLSLVQTYYDLGARYITLTHTRNNHFSDSSNDPSGALHHGLSSKGRELVKLMNRMGMMIDVSHISDEAFSQVIELSTLPVIASHSNTRAINDDPRNMSDDMLKLLAKNGGVVQLCFLYVKDMPANPQRDSARASLREKYNQFQNLSEEQMAGARREWQEINYKYAVELATVSDLIDHLDHVVKLIGIDHVGIGSDFDGGGELKDCYDVSQMHNITAELLRRNYTLDDIEKIWSGNFMRVFRQNHEAARTK